MNEPKCPEKQAAPGGEWEEPGPNDVLQRAPDGPSSALGVRAGDDPHTDDWAIDTSTGTEILTYKKCSVIEDAQARLVMGLLSAPAPEPVAWRPDRESVARAIMQADDEKAPDGYADGLPDNISDWGAFLADRVLALAAPSPKDRGSSLRDTQPGKSDSSSSSEAV